jgi:hypothetical protein
MPKKNSRAARTNQNTTKRVSSARPLVATEEKPEPGANVLTPIESEAPISITPVVPAVTIAPRPIPSPTGKPIPRRFTNQPDKTANQTLDRVDEYRFIKSDLRLVFILTVLIIIVLVVLTFIIGR